MHKSLKQAFLLIIGTFLTLFLATFITVRTALSGHTPPVDSNYYEKGLNYDQTVATQREMLSQGYDFEADWFQKQSSLQLGKQNITVRFHKNAEPVSGAELQLKLERSATDSFNQIVALNEISKGTYGGEINVPFAGSWRIVLSAKSKDGNLEKTRQIRIEP
ncbi:FixH family protein [Leptospira sp. 'Mane']|uniref:FixH family protein n=1 Tax=Leptospira sp. 'Mane' TaxID=3387407 RepID=UPI00398B1870